MGIAQAPISACTIGMNNKVRRVGVSLLLQSEHTAVMRMLCIKPLYPCDFIMMGVIDSTRNTS